MSLVTLVWFMQLQLHIRLEYFPSTVQEKLEGYCVVMHKGTQVFCMCFPES